MPVITSGLNINSSDFKENFSCYEEKIKILRERQTFVVHGGRDKSIERHLARGKVMVRDRIDYVVDENSSFLELSTLAGFGQYDGSAPGAGIVTGIGLVHGQPCICLLYTSPRPRD